MKVNFRSGKKNSVFPETVEAETGYKRLQNSKRQLVKGGLLNRTCYENVILVHLVL